MLYAMSLAALIISITICPYFILVTPVRYYLYSLTIFLYLLASIGVLLKIMHYPGGDEFLTVGLMSELLAGTFLIIAGIKSADSKFKAYKIMLGILLIVHLLLSVFYSFFHTWDLYALVTVLPCAILLITGWILVSKRTLHEGENNLLIVILVQSIATVVGLLKMAPLSWPDKNDKSK